MQPYFLPYLGYFMLIEAVDRFVIFDDAQYTVRGWINRNNLLFSGGAHPFVLPVRKAGGRRLIGEMELADYPQARRKLLELFRHAYAKAPFYGNVRPLLEDILCPGMERLEPLLTRSLKMICDYLGIKTTVCLSSETAVDSPAEGKEKIIPLCERHGASEYINARGGMALYGPSPFAERGIALKFLVMADVRYSQFQEPFVPNLSIIDVLMFNSVDDCRRLLGHYSLAAPTKEGESHAA